MRAIGWLFAVVGAVILLGYLAGMSLVWTHALEELPVWVHATGGAGAACIGLWLFLDWGSLSDLGKDQTVGQSFTAGITLLVGLAILVAANWVGVRFDKRWDLTQTKRYSLSPQSIDVTKALDREVAVLGFFVKGSPEEGNFLELMKGYTEQSTLLKLEMHDPYVDAWAVEQEGITSPSGTAIFKLGEAEQRVEYDFDEEAVTNALIKLTSSKTHSVCSITGHGEGKADDSYSPSGLGALFGRMQKQNYTVQSLALLDQAPTPDSCEVLVLPGPQTDLLPAELDRIAAYVAAGGNFVALLNPIDAPLTAADMSRYGVKLGNDVVVEGDPYRQIAGGGPTWVVLSEDSFDPHPITDDLRGQVVLPLARSVGKGPEVAGLKVQELARSTDASWAETKLDQTGDEVAEPTEGEDIIGKVPLMVAVEVADPRAIPTTLAPAAALDGAPSLGL
ncbi:MAG: GldG family protein, partial [Deltaproteobacteria bacterium]|nr:GldG family protein [Deltaproteobacteria bacterium]